MHAHHLFRYLQNLSVYFWAKARIALITNCDVIPSTAKMIDIIVPTHSSDVIQTTEKQWLTRMLYNGPLPFNYSFITDTHVFPCDNRSYSDIFDLIKISRIEISLTCRINVGPLASGGAALSKWDRGSYELWIRTYKLQQKAHSYDDQGTMTNILGVKTNDFHIDGLAVISFMLHTE